MSIAATTALLAGFTAFNVLLSLLVVRKVRPLQALIEERGIPDRMLPRTGLSIGRFRVEMADGGVLIDEEVRSGTALIGFFLPHCPSCDRMHARLLAEPPPWPVVAFVEGKPDDPEAQAEVAKFAAVARSGFATEEVARALGLSDESAFPTLVRVENGIVTAAGRRLPQVIET
jgi:thiol-disulfide isomerase/thioredoxin